MNAIALSLKFGYARLMPKPLTYSSNVFLRLEPELRARIKQLKEKDEKEADLLRQIVLNGVEVEEAKRSKDRSRKT